MKTKKLRILSALLAVAMLFALMPTAAFADNAPGGNCGKDGSDVKWSFDTTTGTLTISGTGAMEEYENHPQRPWIAHKNEIKKVVIGEEVTTIGKHAFADCSQLSTVELPQNGKLKKIGYNAFGCIYGSAPIITEIVIPNSVEEIAPYAFDHCTQLATVKFASGSQLKTIGLNAFQHTAIEEVRIPASVEGLGVKGLETEPMFGGGWTFYNCSNLKKVVFESPSKLNYVSNGNFSGCSEDLIICCMDETVIEKLTETGDMNKGNVDRDTIKPTYPTVTFDFDNGTEAKNKQVENGQKVPKPETDPTKEDYIFAGWYTKDESGKWADKPFDFSTPITDNMTLYARWGVEAMPKAADNDDSGWDAATVVTGAVIGTGTAILAYHIGMEVYAEQVLGKDVAVPRTRAEVALLAWQLAGSPAVNVEGEPLSEAAQAEKWAVESGLMQPDAEGNFNGTKKMSKWNALRTLDSAKKLG